MVYLKALKAGKGFLEGYFLEWSVMHPFITRSSIWSIIHQILLTRIIEAHSLCRWYNCLAGDTPKGYNCPTSKTVCIYFQSSSINHWTSLRKIARRFRKKSTSKCRKWLKRLRVFPVSIECFKRRSQNTHRCYRVIQDLIFTNIPGTCECPPGGFWWLFVWPPKEGCFFQWKEGSFGFQVDYCTNDHNDYRT